MKVLEVFQTKKSSNIFSSLPHSADLSIAEMQKVSPDQSPDLQKSRSAANTEHYQELADVFKVFDRNGDGKISVSELGAVLRSLGEDPSEVELQLMVGPVDADGDGHIDFQEFINLCRGIDPGGDVAKPHEVQERDRNQTVTCEGIGVTIAGAERKPFADLHFTMKHIGVGVHSQLVLVLNQMDYGIRNCCTRQCISLNRSCDSSCSPFFIYKITILVRPKSCIKAGRQPVLEPVLTPEEFGWERSTTRSFQLTLGNPGRASFNHQSGRVISSSVRSHRWAPTSRDVDTNLIMLPWELCTFANGRKFGFSNFMYGSRPQLGFQPGYVQLLSEPSLVKATWKKLLVNDKPWQGQQLKWDLKVILHTAVIRKKCFRLYSIKEGPQFTFDRELSSP